jgi:homocysteine S-methyltransferase
MHPFLEQLSRGVLVADGAMGSLIARSLPPEAPLAMARGILEVNLAHPEIVHAIHLQYIQAGAQCIATNTFGASRARLERLGLGEHAGSVVSAGLKLARPARDASGRPAWIAGSIGPLDADWVLDSNPSDLQQIAQFEEQVAALLERGADFVLLETFSRLDQLLLAIQAVRNVDTSCPLVASMSFDEYGESETGETAETAARAITATGRVQVIGANCSVGPQASLALVEQLAAGTTLPLSVMPNAGFAQRLGGRVLYPDMSRSYYEAFARRAAELGARLIGGCCGTTPEQIGFIRDSLQRSTPDPETRPRVRAQAEGPAAATPTAVPRNLSRLMTKLRSGAFVRSLQIDPQRGPSDQANRDVAAVVRESQLVDVIDINSSGGSGRQDSLQIAAGIERLGVETLPHITPRDASVRGALAQVLGAYDWGGIRNVLVIIGDPPKGDLYAEAKGVYQVDAIGLVRALDRLRSGRHVDGRVTTQAFELGIGVALNQNAPDIEAELRRLEEKIQAGADFVMTQPFFTLDDWLAFRPRLLNRFDVPFILGVWPLVGAKQARRINENVSGVVIPEQVCRMLETAGPAEREVGFRLAAELVARLEREQLAAGAYVVAPFKQPRQALEIFERAAAHP